MPKVEVGTTIDRPVEDVFAVVSNVEHNPRWSAATLEAEQTSPGPVGVGSTARVVIKLFGKRFESVSTITEFEPNRKLAAELKSGPFPFRGTWIFEPVDGGTRVTVNAEAESGGFFKLAEPLFVSMGKRQLQGDLANLKDLMEGGAL